MIGGIVGFALFMGLVVLGFPIAFSALLGGLAGLSLVIGVIQTLGLFG